MTEVADHFEAFASRVVEPERLAGVAAVTGVDAEWLGSNVATALAESRHTLHLIEAHLAPRVRMLEVGSGLGLTSAFLASEGHDITSIEPGGSGFEHHERVNPALRAALGVEHRHHVVDVESVTRESLGGPFDLVFSNNVIEHVDDVDRAFVALAALLNDDAVMLHHCPNYSVPYEPHFGIPLLPGRPAATAKILPARIADSSLWASLNFVRARDVAALGDRLGASVEFRAGVLADSFARLGEAEFGERHPVLRRVGRVMAVLDPLVRRLPPRWVTPMTFTWRPPSGLSDHSE